MAGADVAHVYIGQVSAASCCCIFLQPVLAGRSEYETARNKRDDHDCQPQWNRTNRKNSARFIRVLEKKTYSAG